MTVVELIELLQSLPGDLPVYLSDWNESYEVDFALTGREGPVVLPACEVKKRGISISLPERVVIGMNT